MVEDLSSYSLAGTLCLVTGGGTGIGRGIAASMAAAGARVIITGRRSGPLEDVRAEVGPAVIPVVHDVSHLPTIPAFLDSLEREYGPITTLVNNAGVHQKKSSFEVSDEDLDHVLRTNARAVFALTREAALRMSRRDGGSIQIISSMAALFGIPYVASYTMSKAAVSGLVRELAVEWGEYGIRINAIASDSSVPRCRGRRLTTIRIARPKCSAELP